MWGSAFVGIRALAGTFSPGSIAIGRLLVGILVLAIVATRVPRPAISRSDLVSVLLFGLLWFGVYSVLLNAGEREMDAGTAALLVSLGPILIALFAGAFLKEGIPSQLLLGCLVAFVGTAIVATSSSAGAATATVEGVAIVLIATVAYAVAATLQKRALRNVPAAWVNLIGAAAAAMATLPFAPGLVDELAGADLREVGWLIFLGVFPTALGYTTWAYALARTSAGRTAAVTYLIPPFAIVMGWIVLAELPKPLAVLGGIVSIVGVALARRKTPPRLPLRRLRTADDP